MSVRESDFDCPHCADAAAYVLGSLEQGELERYREHLAGCAQCRAEVADLQVVVDELPASVPPAAPSEQMRAKILATVRSEAALLHAAGASADRPHEAARHARWRWGRGSIAGAGVALAAAIAAIAIAIGSSGQSKLVVIRGKGEGPARTAQVSLQRRDGQSELVVANMPQPALGKIYEVWLSRGRGDAEPTNALFSVTGHGSAAVDVPNSLHDIREVMVTSEPLGGSLHPTSAPLIRVVLPA